MRVVICGGNTEQAARVAGALARDGLTVTSADGACDLHVTLGPALPRRQRFGPVTVDWGKQQAERDGQPLRLTGVEFRLLAHLAQVRRPVARDELLAAVWGYDFDPGTNLVAVHICRLRAKLGPDMIAGGRGGYRLLGQPPHFQPASAYRSAAE